jgi:transposase-like protein
MKKKRYTPEQIIEKLREAEVRLSKGESVGKTCRSIGVSEQTYYRWRREYNTIRPHSSLGYRPPAPETIQPSSCTPFIPPLSSAPLNGEYTRPLN